MKKTAETFLHFIKKIFDALDKPKRQKIYSMLDKPFNIKNIESIKLPLILISQVQRSGGSLLSQLFDGHNNLYSHPSEIFFLKNNWPNLDDIRDTKSLILRMNNKFQEYVYFGYHKSGIIDQNQRISFDFNFGLQEEILQQIQTYSIRELLDLYFESFFNSWLNHYKSIEPFNPKYIVGFSPRTNIYLWENHKDISYFDVYPDGYFISIIRDPATWYASARKHSFEYQNPEKALKIYNSSAKSSIEIKKKYPDRTILIIFEELIEKPVEVIKGICKKIDIKFNQILLNPTFNSIAIKSDSSYFPKYGIDKNVLKRTNEIELNKYENYTISQKLYLRYVQASKN